jgi:hypothetical protein
MRNVVLLSEANRLTCTMPNRAFIKAKGRMNGSVVCFLILYYNVAIGSASCAAGTALGANKEGRELLENEVADHVQSSLAQDDSSIATLFTSVFLAVWVAGVARWVLQKEK